MFRRLPSLAILCASLATFAQTQARGNSLAREFLVHSWQSEDGLPGNVLRSVVQASDGYLWVATAEGVVRFDGLRFRSPDVEGAALLARTSPRTLFALPDGSVWVAAVRGGLLRCSDRRVESILPEADASAQANRVAVTQVAPAPHEPGSVLIARGEELWKWRAGSAAQPCERTPAIEACLHADLQTARQSGRFVARHADVTLHDDAGRVWTAPARGGLVLTTPEGHSERLVLPPIESQTRIVEIHRDREGGVWLATGETGLVQLHQRRVRTLTTEDGLSDRTALAVLCDRSGALWVGSPRGRVDRVSPGGTVETFELGEAGVARPIAALCEDGDGAIWAATREGSVFRMAGDGAFRAMFPPASGVTKVRAIACDTARREMWFAMQQGIARWDGQTVTRFGEESGAPASDVTSLLIDRSQTVWAGTATGAVFRGRGGRFDRLGSDASLEGSYVSSLQEVRSTREAGIWITTLGAGLFRWTESSGFMRFSLEEGLPERRLTWVIDGPGDRLWLGSLSGILGVHRHDLHRPRAPRSSEPQWLLLDRADGMLSRECTGGFHPAGALGPAGQIWFPTVKGVVELRPVAVRWDATPPSVVIEECRAGGRALDLTEPIVVGPGRKRLEFRYTALELGAPGKARFRVRLAGLESEESDPRSDRTASYEAVPPGRYRFVVRAANGDGVWTSGGASLAVEVLPHFWETRWFRASVAAVAVAGAAGIGWFAAHLRMRRKLTRLELQSAREQERARIAQDLHDDLGASLTELSLLAHLAAEAPSAPREPLPEIAEKAQALAGALDEIVWAVNPRHDTLASLADYVAAFAAEFLKTAGIGLRLDFPREMPRLMIDSERRHSLFLAVREALNNVVKHSRAREVLVRFALEDGWLRIMVHDDGRGIAHGDEGGLGEGLRGMQERLVRCGGTCRVESAAGKGTTVHFSLPV